MRRKNYLSLDGLRRRPKKPVAPSPGKHKVRVVKTSGDTSDPISPCLWIRFEVVGRGVNKGRTVLQPYPLTQKHIGRLVNLLDACRVDYRRPEGGFGFRPQDLIDREIIVRVGKLPKDPLGRAEVYDERPIGGKP